MTESWISLDELILRAPVAFAQTRAGRVLMRDRAGECGGCRCRCCCCCCCCKKDEPEPEPPPMLTEPLSVGFRAIWELLIDPTTLAAPAGVKPKIAGLRGELRWRARGKQGTLVDVELRSEGADGRPAGQYPTWTAIIRDQAPVDVASFTVDPSMGHTLRLRARARDADGNVAYADIVTISPGA